MTVTTTHGYAALRPLLSLMTGDEKHDPASISTLDAIWVLYDHVLRASPGTADSPDRDWFLLSKGHGPSAYYAVLAANAVVAEMLLHLCDQRAAAAVGGRYLDRQGVVDPGQNVREDGVDDNALDFDDLAG